MPRILTLRLAALVAAFALVAAAAPGTDPEAGRPTPRSTGADLAPAATTYPTNAAKIFRWGNAQWYDDFISPVKRMWSINHPSPVSDQHGMLTINGDRRRRHGVGDADRPRPSLRPLGDPGARRAVQPGATPYRVVAELIPARATTAAARATSCSVTTRWGRAGRGCTSATPEPAVRRRARPWTCGPGRSTRTPSR